MGDIMKASLLGTSLLILVHYATNVNAFSLFSVPSRATGSSLFSSHTKSKTPNAVTLTYLEINSWLVTANGVTILIDPLLEGALDFGIPSLYQGKKRVLPPSGLTEALPPVDCILITQGLDDHAHVRTLEQIQKLDPTVPIVAPPSAKGALRAAGFDDGASQIRFLYHGEEATIHSRDSRSKDKNPAAVSVLATQGALVGPPWQRRENGYILVAQSNGASTSKGSSKSGPSIYIEPHVEFNERELSKLAPVDVVIAPMSGQTLPAFELVHGPKDTVRLLETLRPKYLLAMQNGDIDTEGPASRLVSIVGSPDEFKERLAKSSVNGQVELVDVQPGKDIELIL